MDKNTLKYRVRLNLPIYLGNKEISVIEICDFFNLVEIESQDGRIEFVEVCCLSDEPDYNTGVPLSLFKPKGGKNDR